MKRTQLSAEVRKTLGHKVKKLRKDGLLPGNIYGNKIKSIAVQVKLNEFKKIWDEVGETGLIDVVIGEKAHPVLIHGVQSHPVSNQLLHADFHEVSLTEKTTAKVSIELTGESPAVNQNLGV